MADLRKKFIDILFEDEEAEEILDDSHSIKELPKATEESHIKAKDIMYRKSGGSAFINLDEKPNEEFTLKDIDKDINDYEFSTQISPIFGVIRNGDQPKEEVNKEVIDAHINKPADSHLEIITSPIFGYGKQVINEEDEYDNDNLKRLSINKIDIDDESDLHHLFDDNNDDSYDTSNNSVLMGDDEDINLFSLFGDDK